MTEDNYTIRKASTADLVRIHEIYAAARRFMRDQGNFSQWDGEDAPERLLPGDIEAGNLYVLEENGARAVVCAVGFRLAIQVDVVIDAADEHEDDENHTGDEQRVQNGRLKALLNGAGEHIGDAGDEDAEKRGIRRNII